MHERKHRRIFWFEGVTRNEVQRSLDDMKPSRLRRQAPRRQLVVVASLVIVALALALFIPDRKVGSYAQMILLATSLLLYFSMRKSVRHVSDAPDEMLDERQIAIRNAGYTIAYRLLATLSVPYLVLLMLILPGGLLSSAGAMDNAISLLLSYVMCCANLPAMVLAWRMPDEPSPSAD